MTMLKHFDTFYQTLVVLVVCSQAEFKKKFPDIDIEGADGITACCNECMLIWLPKFKLGDPKDISVLVHECTHAVFYMALSKDIPLTREDPPNSEQLAYSLDHLVLALLQKLSKHGKRKAAKSKKASGKAARSV